MKRVEVLSFAFDDNYLNSSFPKQVIELWIKSEEGKFIEKHSLAPIEMRKIRQPHSYKNKIELWATLEEKHEIFWRLKFK